MAFWVYGVGGLGGDIQGGGGGGGGGVCPSSAGDALREVAQRGLARRPVQPVRSLGGCWCPLRESEGAFLNWGDALASSRCAGLGASRPVPGWISRACLPAPSLPFL